MADHLSTWLFCPTETAVANLKREGIQKGVWNTGDVLYDSLDQALPVARSNPGILNRLGMQGNGYALVTLHRAENTDDGARLRGLVHGLLELEVPVVFPVHPRARAALEQIGLWESVSGRLRVTDPLGYIDCLRLTQAAQLVITDSGGLQREASALGVPCLVARDETEWIEELQNGRTMLCGPAIDRLPVLVKTLLAKARTRPDLTPRVGASRRVCEVLENNGRKPLANG
jgi:UDP-N-acetylglucosamine 2-epimerase